ncbi:hypothetical protein SP41_81 [Salmonella phage 41]|nr:hypothetical protein SP41_81 [Salmonella phage 41]
MSPLEYLMVIRLFSIYCPGVVDHHEFLGSEVDNLFQLCDRYYL